MDPVVIACLRISHNWLSSSPPFCSAYRTKRPALRPGDADPLLARRGLGADRCRLDRRGRKASPRNTM